MPGFRPRIGPAFALSRGKHLVVRARFRALFVDRVRLPSLRAYTFESSVGREKRVHPHQPFRPRMTTLRPAFSVDGITPSYKENLPAAKQRSASRTGWYCVASFAQNGTRVPHLCDPRYMAFLLSRKICLTH